MKRKIKFIAAGLAAFLAVVSATAYVDTFVIPNANILFGKNNTADKSIYFNNNAGIPGNPIIRMHAGQLQFANDGVTFNPISAGVPSGAEVFWPVDTAPTGWLLEDGSCYSRTVATYTALFAAIGTRYGIGDGLTTFCVPDSRGTAPRVPDDGAGLDADVATRTNYVSGVFGGTFNITADSNGTTTLMNLSATDCANVSVGQTISGGDMATPPVYVTATSCGSFSITISQAATGTNPGESLTLTNGATGPYAGSYEGDSVQDHAHESSVWNNNVGPGNPYIRNANATGFSGYEGTTGMISGNPDVETKGKNIYHWMIIKL